MRVTVGYCFPQAGGIIQDLVASQLLEALGSFCSCVEAWKAAVEVSRGKVKARVSVILFLLSSFAQVLPSFLWTLRQAALSIQVFKEIIMMKHFMIFTNRSLKLLARNITKPLIYLIHQVKIYF